MTAPNHDIYGAADCDHDWYLPDPGGQWTADNPWRVYCRRCKVSAVACQQCTYRPVIEGSSWCSVCRPRIRATLPTFEQMIAHPWSQPDTDRIIYRDVLPQTAALPVTPPSHKAGDQQ